MPLSRIQTTLLSGDISDSVLRSLLVPPAPTGVTATAGNTQATVVWSAPTVLTQTPITDYTVQYSANSGSTWTTFTRSASTSTTVSVTGLTNGQGYVFRVAAVNGIGTGTYSTVSNSVTPTTFSNPSSVSGLQLWLDASDASTLFDATTGGSLVAADGGVARWEDKSGNGRHMTQGTAGSRPARKTAIQGGLDVLRFDGSADFMSVASSTATFKFLHGSAYSIFAVVRIRALNTREFIFETGPLGSPSGDAASLGAALAIFSDGKLFHFVRAGGTAEINNQSAASAFSSGSSYVVSIVGDVGSGTAAARSVAKINAGSAIQNNTQTDTPSTSNARINLTIGRGIGYQGDGSVEYDEYADLDFCEVILYDNDLSDTNRAAVESYLMSKWDIA